ncbi:MAG: M15 family metallopeptidase, partial [Acidobacteriota bacterium]
MSPRPGSEEDTTLELACRAAGLLAEAALRDNPDREQVAAVLSAGVREALGLDAPAPGTALETRPGAALVYEGRAFTPVNDAKIFRCAPSPAQVTPATLLPSATTDPDPAVREALRLAGCSATDVAAFEKAGGIPPLRPFAEVFGGAALGEVIRRLRYTPQQLQKPPHGYGEAKFLAALGLRNHVEILPARLLMAVPGHFRELARRAPGEAEAHALETFGWLLMKSLAGRAAPAPGKVWWTPAAPPFVISFASSLPQLSQPVSRMIQGAQDYQARFNVWSQGPAGRQWRYETGRAESTDGPGRPFYIEAVSVPPPFDFSADTKKLDTLWAARLRTVDGRHKELSAESTRELIECHPEPGALKLMGSVSLGGLALTMRFPRLASPGDKSVVTSLTMLQTLKPTFELLFKTLHQLGWGDLAFETQGAFCFRGTKGGGAAAARNISNHSYGTAVDLMTFENPQGFSTSAIDPRLVALFEAFSFKWGRCFKKRDGTPIPDAHHFQYCGQGCATGAAQGLEALAAGIGGIGSQTVALDKIGICLKIQPPCIPARTSGDTGPKFLESVKSLKGPDREKLILAELLKGNIPGFLRRLKPVTVTFTDKAGARHTATYKVMPDYLAIGDDKDWVRIPINAITAQKVADKYCMSLPTARMVEDIFRNADIKMVRIARDYYKRDGGKDQDASPSYLEHHQAIQKLLADKYEGKSWQDLLLAGHKKDVVIADRLWSEKKLAFYGFFDERGKAEQVFYMDGAAKKNPVPGKASLAHEPTYADYSHGVRLVSRVVEVDGKEMDISDLLHHPDLYELVYHELTGPMKKDARIPTTMSLGLGGEALQNPATRPAESRTGSPIVYAGRPFTPSSDATIFRCPPTPVPVAPATQLPSETTDPDPAIRTALGTAGLSAAQIATFESNGGLPGLRPFAETLGAAALGEVLARLRYTPGRFLDPPRNLPAGSGIRVRHHVELLPARLLLAVPGHFRQLARQAPDEREAHALESFGWMLMKSLASQVSAATSRRWWTPTPPPFVTAFSSTLPPLSQQVQRMVLRSMLIDTLLTFQDYQARFNAWSQGPAGRQWRFETGRDASAGAAGRPFYPQVVAIPAAVNISAQKTRIDGAWSTWVRETEAAHVAGSEETTTILRTCHPERISGLGLLGAASLGGL